MVGTYSPQDVVNWLVPGRELFLAIQLLGIACFVLYRGEADGATASSPERSAFRSTIRQVWEESSSSGWDSGSIRATSSRELFTFLSLRDSFFWLLRAFTVLIVGLSPNFVMPGLSGRSGQIYEPSPTMRQPSSSSVWSWRLARRLIFKPARYAVPAKYGKGHTADAVFLLGLIALLMVADSLFAASRFAGHAQQGQPAESLAVLSLPWMLQIAIGSMPLATLLGTQRRCLPRSRDRILFPAVLPALWNPVPRGDVTVQHLFLKAGAGNS